MLQITKPIEHWTETNYIELHTFTETGGDLAMRPLQYSIQKFAFLPSKEKHHLRAYAQKLFCC